jgi:UDP-2,3-diacylglucosamine pyrophosphatase LpxH
MQATDFSGRYRSVWISDVHLGFPGCNADYLLDFLHSTQCEYLYLVGDIIDVWFMGKRVYWPQSHNNVIRAILGKAKHGTRVIYVPGNHDEVFRDYDGMTFGNVLIKNEALHITADGRRFLVTHGDEFDAVVRCSRTLAFLGTRLYDKLLRINGLVNMLRRRFGFGHWSLARFLKFKVKNAVQYISNFETAVAYEVSKRDLDGMICGHIHHAEMAPINGILYCNTGDWVESCTALVERYDGSMELLHWSDYQRTVKQIAPDSLKAAA